MRHRRDRQGHAGARVRRRDAGGDLQHLPRAGVRQVHDPHQQPQAAARAARGAGIAASGTPRRSTRSTGSASRSARRSRRGSRRRRGRARGGARACSSVLAATRTPRETLARLRAMQRRSESFAEGLARARGGVRRHARARRARAALRIDLSIARGLDYYTGTIYETFLDDHRQLGSICSGGRYDNLAGHYTKSKLPGVGISIGATRLFSQLLEMKVIGAARGAVAQVLRARASSPRLAAAYAGMASELRDGRAQRRGLRRRRQAGQAAQVRRRAARCRSR